MDGTHTKMNENDATIFIPIRVSSYPCFQYPWLFSQVPWTDPKPPPPSYPCFQYPWLFSQEFPMDGTHTKMNENDATIFIPIRVSSYPCFQYPWLFL